MNINQLEYFQFVCKYESISKAAIALHVSPSAISKSIRELEKEFEAPLFHRINNTLFLTSDGQYLLSYIDQILSDVDQLYKQVHDRKKGHDRIRIGMTPLVGSSLLPPFYQELQDYDCSLHLDLAELNILPLLDDIANERLDAGLIISNELDLSRFGVIPLLDTSLFFCTNIGNPLSKLKKISMEDLGDEPLVLVTPDSVENRLLSLRFREKNITPNILFYSDQVYTIQHMINHEIASSFLYDIIVPRNREICQIPLEDPITLHISMVWKKDRYLHDSMQKFIRFAKKFTFSHYHG